MKKKIQDTLFVFIVGCIVTLSVREVVNLHDYVMSFIGTEVTLRGDTLIVKDFNPYIGSYILETDETVSLKYVEEFRVK